MDDFFQSTLRFPNFGDDGETTRRPQKPPPEDKLDEPKSDEDIDDVPYLSGKPSFDIILSKSHVHPHYSMLFPTEIIRKLPKTNVPAVLRCDSKNWDTTYLGNYSWPRLDLGWKKFVIGNGLEVGDACVFEVMESNDVKMKFKVHVLKNEVPPELKNKLTPEIPQPKVDVDPTGMTPDNPITIV